MRQCQLERVSRPKSPTEPGLDRIHKPRMSISLWPCSKIYASSCILNEDSGLNRLDHPLRALGSGSSHPVSDSSSSGSLKRVASPICDDDTRRKRLKECGCNRIHSAPEDVAERIDGEALVEELAQELQCGCCSELVYKPVIVSPCQHFFCGRDRKSTRLNSSHSGESRMPSSA